MVTTDAAGAATTARRAHWDGVYQRVGSDNVSWYQPVPLVSLALLDRLAVSPDAAVVDIGGGASLLVDHLVAGGRRDVTVVDVSSVALEATRRRLGAAGATVTFESVDVLAWEPTRRFDVWHDRAVFHFLTDDEDRRRYRELVRRAVRPGGAVVIGAFALDGPTHCSGLEVCRYDVDTLVAEIGAGFELVDSRRETHTTPAGATQSFVWVALRASGDGD